MQSWLCVTFLYDVLTAEHMLILRWNQQRQVRRLKVHRSKDESRKRETSTFFGWKIKMAKIVSLLIWVREISSLCLSFFTIRHMRLHILIPSIEPLFTYTLLYEPMDFNCNGYKFTKNRSLHQEQKFPPLQVIKSGKECCLHCGRWQQVHSQTWEGCFCRGKHILGVLSL